MTQGKRVVMNSISFLSHSFKSHFVFCIFLLELLVSVATSSWLYLLSGKDCVKSVRMFCIYVLALAIRNKFDKMENDEENVKYPLELWIPLKALCLIKITTNPQSLYNQKCKSDTYITVSNKLWKWQQIF